MASAKKKIKSGISAFSLADLHFIVFLKIDFPCVKKKQKKLPTYPYFKKDVTGKTHIFLGLIIKKSFLEVK